MKHLSKHHITLIVVNVCWLIAFSIFVIFSFSIYEYFDLGLRHHFVHDRDAMIHYTITNDSGQELQDVSIIGLTDSEHQKPDDHILVYLSSVEKEEVTTGSLKPNTTKSYGELWLRYKYQGQWKYVYLANEYGPTQPIVLTITNIDTNGDIQGKMISGEWSDEKDIHVTPHPG